MYEPRADFRRAAQAIDLSSKERRWGDGTVRAPNRPLVREVGFSGIVGVARRAGCLDVHPAFISPVPYRAEHSARRFGLNSKLYGEGPLNKSKRSTLLKLNAASGDRVNVQPEAFVFCERESGAMRFSRARPRQKEPCLWSGPPGFWRCTAWCEGSSPAITPVLVVPSGGLPDAIGQRAEELLEASQATISYRARLTRREGEVLQCLLRHESNTEIAAQLYSLRAHREIPRVRAAGEIQGAGSRRAYVQSHGRWFAAGEVGVARYAFRVPRTQYPAGRQASAHDLTAERGRQLVQAGSAAPHDKFGGSTTPRGAAASSLLLLGRCGGNCCRLLSQLTTFHQASM